MSYEPLNKKFFAEHKADLHTIAFDLDDTLTQKGEVPAYVHEKLERARAKGIRVVLVTGRAAGWVDAICKVFPFDGIVGENGALLQFWPRGKLARKPREEAKKLFWTPQGYAAQPPAGIREHHENAIQVMAKKFPRARVASDQPYRIYDLAIDFAEEVDPPLGLDVANQIQAEFENLGATAKVSSIHVNGWWGSFTKVDGLRRLLEVEWTHGTVAKNLIYVGDSPNDGPLFKVAACSVGVANVLEFRGHAGFDAPRFVCKHESAEGSAELLDMLLSV